MAAGSTYTPIATTTLGSAQASYTFSSIPSTYTDLVIIINGTADNNIGARFNSDSGSNYSATRIQGDGTSASSSRFTNTTYVVGSYSSTTQASIWQFMNYSNSTTYKTALNRGGSGSDRTEAYVGTWRNTAAITSITMLSGTGNLSSGTTLTLYGIQAA
jgi:hypothetical protein